VRSLVLAFVNCMDMEIKRLLYFSVLVGDCECYCGLLDVENGICGEREENEKEGVCRCRL